MFYLQYLLRSFSYNSIYLKKNYQPPIQAISQTISISDKNYIRPKYGHCQLNFEVIKTKNQKKPDNSFKTT